MNTNYKRETISKCPYCIKDVNATIIQEGESVYLERKCPEHGLFRYLLSTNGNMYCDFDHFYFSYLKGNETNGRLTNHWVLINNTCQMDCPYCEVELNSNYFEFMTKKDFLEILAKIHKAKCTLTGGEPTIHPNILEFIQLASQKGLHVTLATNGVALASQKFCEELKAAGISEVRFSIESFDKSQAEKLGTGQFYEKKIIALENLDALKIPTTLSPTIFQGINEDQLLYACEYAKNKSHVRSLSINGFAYFTNCANFGHEHMIMPDRMAEILYKYYSNEPLEDLYTFEKFIHTLLHLLKIKVCFYTPLFMLVRHNNTFKPITEFMALSRIKRMLSWWTKSTRYGITIQRISFLLVLLFSFNYKSISIFPDLLRLFFANSFEVKVGNYPPKILPIVLNTNCSVLSLDATLAKQCMSSFFMKKNDTIQQSVSTDGLMEKEFSHNAYTTK